jgi:hypothetical protein
LMGAASAAWSRSSLAVSAALFLTLPLMAWWWLQSYVSNFAGHGAVAGLDKAEQHI